MSCIDAVWPWNESLESRGAPRFVRSPSASNRHEIEQEKQHMYTVHSIVMRLFKSDPVTERSLACDEFSDCVTMRSDIWEVANNTEKRVRIATVVSYANASDGKAIGEGK